MNTLTRKQREMKEREARILAVSRPMLVEQGYHGLNMDRVAEALEYSKGTIYNHFSCKEEIIIALAIDTMERRTKLFQRAAGFHGQSRERLSAIGRAAEIFVRLFPDHFTVEQIIRASSIWEKTSEKRRSVMQACEQRCVGIVAGIVRDAVAQGDLALPDQFSPEQLVFGLWSMTYGAHTIITTSQSLDELGVLDPFETLHQDIHRMLDGFRWRPLLADHDYESVDERITNEVFRDEFSALGMV